MYIPEKEKEPLNPTGYRLTALFLIFVAIALIVFAKFGVGNSESKQFERLLATFPAVISIVAAIVFLLKARSDPKYSKLNKSKCPSCGYNIRKLPNPRCPECGETWNSRFVAQTHDDI